MTDPETKQRWSPTNLRVGAIVAVILGVGLLAWILLGSDDNGDESAGTEAAGARVVSVEELQEIAGSSDRPVFWAGPRSGAKYEVTETSDGSVYVRYLPQDADVG